VHGEKLVVDLGTEQMQIRVRQLQPQQDRFQATEDQEHQGRDEIAQSDSLVIDGGESAPQGVRGLPESRELQ